jgi:8-oxo-dGTP diphosphatase
MSINPLPPKRRGVVAVIPRDGRLLVVRRSQQVLAAGAYCFPGGGIENGESETEALVRELREELSAEVRPIRRLWECTTSWGVWLAWWLSDLVSCEEMVPDPAEVASVAWYTPAEMAALPGLLESNREFLEAVTAGQIDLQV